MERYRDHQKDLYMVSIDLKEAYDRVPREALWRVLEKKEVWVAHMQDIKNMYIEQKHMLELVYEILGLFLLQLDYINTFIYLF